MNQEVISTKAQTRSRTQPQAQSQPRAETRPQQEWLIYLFASLIITFFLFYIDEGYNNFNWTKDPGNWFAFIIYIVPIYCTQILLGQVLLRKYAGWGKFALSIVLGSAIAIYIVVSILTGSWW